MTTTDSQRPAGAEIARRVHFTLGPIAAALLLDALDLVTFGPIGLYAGFLLGAGTVFWLTSIYRFSVPMRLFWSAFAGLYCTTPCTEFLPIATMLSAAHRFFHWTAE